MQKENINCDFDLRKKFPLKRNKVSPPRPEEDLKFKEEQIRKRLQDIEALKL